MSAQPSPVESLAGALVDAQDQLLALYELTTLTSTSLDEAECVAPILDRAKKLLHLDTIDFVASDVNASEPPSVSGSELSLTVSNDDLAGRLTATRQSALLGTAEHKLLRAVAHLALSAVHTSRLHAEALEQAVIGRDHQIASTLAQQSLPTWRPAVEGLKVFARSDPARAAGGDLFTFVKAGSWLNVVVGDVSGKGLPAAIMMSTVVSASNAAMKQHSGDPVAVLQAIDSWVYQQLSDAGMFVTMFACAVNSAERELIVANAGHSPVMLIEDRLGRHLDASAPPVGVLPLEMTGLVAEHAKLAAWSRLAIGSDGLNEQLNSHGEMFGDRRVLLALQSERDAGEVGEALFDAVEDFAQDTPQSDDRTLVLIDVTGEPT